MFVLLNKYCILEPWKRLGVLDVSPQCAELPSEEQLHLVILHAILDILVFSKKHDENNLLHRTTSTLVKVLELTPSLFVSCCISYGKLHMDIFLESGDFLLASISLVDPSTQLCYISFTRRYVNPRRLLKFYDIKIQWDFHVQSKQLLDWFVIISMGFLFFV